MADASGHVVKKRAPQKGKRRRNDIYVNRKTDFAAQLERCQKSLDSSEQEVTIHGLGAAINRAINLALQLEHRGQGTVEVFLAILLDKAEYDLKSCGHQGGCYQPRPITPSKVSVTTSSVKLIDDFEPEDDDQEGYSKVRTNSAIHIKVYKKQLSQVAIEGISKEVT